VGAATISAARTAVAASALVMAAVARRQVLLVLLVLLLVMPVVLSVGTSVGEVGATLVSSPVCVGFPLFAPSAPHGSAGNAPARLR
jgi:hypothetical protein